MKMLSPFVLLNVEQVLFMNKQMKCLRFLFSYICISNAGDNFFSFLFLFSPTLSFWSIINWMLYSLTCFIFLHSWNFPFQFSSVVLFSFIQWHFLLLATVDPGHVFPITQDKVEGGSLGVPASATSQNKSGAQVITTTSGSSRELSDDDELEGETDTTGNMDPADDKRARR